MGQAVTFCYVEGDGQVSVYIELNGKTVVDVVTASGEISKSYEDEIDPRDAQRLITELFDVAPKLPARPDGQLWVSLYNDDDRWDVQLDEYDLPERGLDVGRIMRTIAQDTMAGYQQRSSRRQGGPHQNQMTVFGFVKWTAFFMVGFFLAVITGMVGQVLGGMVGSFAAAASIGLSLFLMEGSFYMVGVKFAEHYRLEFPVWPVAAAAAASCFAIYFQAFGLGSLFSLFFFAAAPGMAHWGYTTSA